MLRGTGGPIRKDTGRILKIMAGCGFRMNPGVGRLFIMGAGHGITGTAGFGCRDEPGLLPGYSGVQAVVMPPLGSDAAECRLATRHRVEHKLF